MSDRPIWHLKYQAPNATEPKEYLFDPQTDLLVDSLRQFKAWYPEEPGLGRYLSFVRLFTEGDPDAAMCALYLVRRKAGEPEVTEPKNTAGSFSIGEFYDRFEPASEQPEADPTSTGAVPTPESTATQTSSEQSSSPSSPTSATSPPEK